MSEHFRCCDVILGRLEIQGLGKGPLGILTGRAVERSIVGGLSFPLSPVPSGASLGGLRVLHGDGVQRCLIASWREGKGKPSLGLCQKVAILVGVVFWLLSISGSRAKESCPRDCLSQRALRRHLQDRRHGCLIDREPTLLGLQSPRGAGWVSPCGFRGGCGAGRSSQGGRQY